MSILTSIKKLLGIAEEDESFDMDIIAHINSVFAILRQLGVGPTAGFAITGDIETWSQIDSNDQKIAMVKSYMYQKVRLLFDPPTNSSHLQAMQNSVNEFEWRLNVAVENTKI